MWTHEGDTAEFLVVHCGSFEVFPVAGSVVSRCNDLEVVGHHGGKFSSHGAVPQGISCDLAFVWQSLLAEGV